MNKSKQELFKKVRKNRRVKVKKTENVQFMVTMLRNNQFVDNYEQALKWMIVSDTLLFMPRFKRKIRSMALVSDNAVSFDSEQNNKPIYSLNNTQKVIELYHPEFINQINYLKYKQNLSDKAINMLKEWIKDKLIDINARSISFEFCEDAMLDMIKKEIIC